LGQKIKGDVMQYTGRRRFLRLSLGASAYLAIGGCAMDGRSGTPLEKQFSQTSGLHTAELRGVQVMYVRRKPTKPIASFMRALRKRFAPGSAIYYYGQFLVLDGDNYATFPYSTSFRRDAHGLYALSDDRKFSFSRAARLTYVADAGEVILRPDEGLSEDMQRQVSAGFARYIGELDNDGRPQNGSVIEDQPEDSGDISDSTDSDVNDTDDQSDEGGGGGSGSGGQGQNNGAIKSSNNQCQGSSENIGISYTVPSGYPSDVTVSLCVNNGSTDVCFYFQNQVPGSSHNVSFSIAGSGAPFVSMGVSYSGGQSNGIGSASMPGC
jgi:hypothetical protein